MQKNIIKFLYFGHQGFVIYFVIYYLLYKKLLNVKYFKSKRLSFYIYIYISRSSPMSVFSLFEMTITHNIIGKDGELKRDREHKGRIGFAKGVRTFSRVSHVS